MYLPADRQAERDKPRRGDRHREVMQAVRAERIRKAARRDPFATVDELNAIVDADDAEEKRLRSEGILHNRNGHPPQRLYWRQRLDELTQDLPAPAREAAYEHGLPITYDRWRHEWSRPEIIPKGRNARYSWRSSAEYPWRVIVPPAARSAP